MTRPALSNEYPVHCPYRSVTHQGDISKWNNHAYEWRLVDYNYSAHKVLAKIRTHLASSAAVQVGITHCAPYQRKIENWIQIVWNEGKNSLYSSLKFNGEFTIAHVLFSWINLSNWADKKPT